MIEQPVVIGCDAPVDISDMMVEWKHNVGWRPKCDSAFKLW